MIIMISLEVRCPCMREGFFYESNILSNDFVIELYRLYIPRIKQISPKIARQEVNGFVVRPWESSENREWQNRESWQVYY